MSKRLQVILAEEELEEIRHAARQQRQTVAEWVRLALRQARAADAARPAAERLRLVREAAVRYSFPTGSIGEINAQISRGYGGED